MAKKPKPKPKPKEESTNLPRDDQLLPSVPLERSE